MAEFCRQVRNLISLCAVATLVQGALGTALSAQDDLSIQDREVIAKADRGTRGSPPIPLDNWMYPAVMRLHDLGYLSTLYVGLRPYTRVSLAHALKLSQQSIEDDEINYGHREEAVTLYKALATELAPELEDIDSNRPVLEQTYARVRGITGPVLNDSFHAGQSFITTTAGPFSKV